MRVMASLAGGLAGALSVTLLQELLRRVDRTAPRLDLLRKQATVRVFEKLGDWSPGARKVNRYSLAGDIVCNTLCYTLPGITRHSLAAGTAVGLGMTAGAFTFPERLGLNKHYASGTTKRKWITAGMFLTGALVSACVSRYLLGNKC